MTVENICERMMTVENICERMMTLENICEHMMTVENICERMMTVENICERKMTCKISERSPTFLLFLVASWVLLLSTENYKHKNCSLSSLYLFWVDEGNNGRLVG